MGLEQAIEAEAQAQAICMQTRDFERAYRAFVAKERPGVRRVTEAGPGVSHPRTPVGYLGHNEKHE